FHVTGVQTCALPILIQENLQNDTRRRRFTDSLLSMYDTCMCQGTSSYLSPAYADKIFGDRTCYGLLFQSRNILSRITSQQASCRSEERRVGKEGRAH